MKKSGIFYTITGAVLYGISPIFAKQLSSIGCKGTEIVFSRNILAVVILFVYLRLSKISIKADRRQIASIAWIALAGQLVTTVLLYKSYEYLSVGTAGTLHFLYPVFVTAILAVVFKEKISGKKLAILLTALAGTLLFLEQGKISAVGAALAVLSGVGFAVYIVGTGKTEAKTLNPVVLTFYISLFVSVYLCIFMVLSGKIAIHLSPGVIFYGIFLSLTTSVFGCLFLQKGIARLGPGTASILCLFEPVTSLFVDTIVYREAVSWTKVGGCILILGSVAMLAGMEKE